MLIDGLPGDSLALTRMRDDLTPEQKARLADRPPAGHGPWSHTDMLLALIADRVAQQTWQLTEWAKGRRPKPPAPVPRPGVDDPGTPHDGMTPLEARLAAASPETRAAAERLRRGESLEPN